MADRRTSFPNSAFSYNLGDRVVTGNVIFVDDGASNASTGNTGLSPNVPKSTIASALSACTASNGDHIVIMPGHSETFSVANAATALTSAITVVDGATGEQLAPRNTASNVGKIKRVSKTVTFTAAAYESTTAVAVFTVTGQVKARAYGIVTTAVEADTGADGAISLGIEDEVDTLCAVVVANETNFAVGDIWGTATTTKNGDVINNTGNWVIIGNGADIEINVTVEDITAGVVDIYVEYEAINATGDVVAV